MSSVKNFAIAYILPTHANKFGDQPDLKFIISVLKSRWGHLGFAKLVRSEVLFTHISQIFLEKLHASRRHKIVSPSHSKGHLLGPY